MTALVTAARQRVDRIKTLVGAARADIIESYQQRDWTQLGYESWDAMCSAEFGTVLRLSVEDRQQAAADLRGAGMSTRAIGSALGVSSETVRRDLASTDTNVAVEEVTGLDGKKRAATRPHAEDDVPRAGLATQQAVQDWLAGDPGIRAANLRRDFARWMVNARLITTFDPAEMADLNAGQADGLPIDLVGSLFDSLADWATSYRAARPTTIRLIKEG